MLQKVEEVINEWDPINLLPLFPPDEYKKEIFMIANFIEQSKDVDKIAEYIFNLFTENFGNNVFNKGTDECKKIASLLVE